RFLRQSFSKSVGIMGIGTPRLRCSLCRREPRAGGHAVRTARSWRGIVAFTHLAREGRMTVTIGRRELLAALGGAARVQLRISLALLMLAVSPVASHQLGETLAQCICHGCGCKGGPGWRDNSTGQCVSHKQLFQICGKPPSEEKCHYEGAPQVCP